MNIFEVNNYPPRFLSTPYQLLGYATLEQIPLFNGSVSDNDTVSERGETVDENELSLDAEIDLCFDV